MIKVDIVSSMSLKTSIGPVQTLKRVKGSIDFFKERGYELNMFTLDALTPTAEAKFKSRESKLLDFARRVAHYLQRHTKFYARNRIMLTYKESKRMLEYYAGLQRQPDIIVFHGWQDCYHYLKYFRKDKSKVCLFIHSDGTHDGNNMQIASFVQLKGSNLEREMDAQLEYTLRNIDVMACITKVEEQNLIDQYPFLKGKTCFVINGISDLSAEQLEESRIIREVTPEKKYRFVSVGSISGRKGHREVIEAVHNMKSELRKDIQVLFVGTGTEVEKMKALVTKYNLQDVIKFVGVVPNNEVYKYQAMSNVSILISKLEGLPLALLEGLRSGLAIISTNVSGIPEIVHDGENGVLINYSQDELNEVFNNLDKYDWDTMGKESRKMFEDFYNFPRMREDYVKMLDKALK